ncbi:calcium-binding protein, partial [Paraburkholderia xenovorans]|uniref:calcium-binding protein n=1 Tax=Paraburkholderia xenovorans TaxID=36873 RepID=UPI0038B75944
GHLEINEVDFSATRNNVLQLGAGISESSVSVSSTSDGSGLVLTDGVSGDQITLDGMLSSRYGVQQVQFADGGVWTSQQLIRLATTGTTGNDV